MTKKRFLSMLVLLCLTVSGAWAQNPDWLLEGDEWDATTKTLTVNTDPEMGAYGGNDEIENVIIANTVTMIGESTFSLCSNLTSVTIAGNEEDGTVIEVDAFKECGNLTTVALGNGGGEIIMYAFNGCGSLTTVIVYAQSVDTWEVESDIFGYEYNDELRIYVPSNLVDDFKDDDGWGYYGGMIEAIPAPTYTVTLKEGTEDATSWQGKAGEGEYQALPLEGVAAGTAVSVKYFGTKKVESVKAVKKAAAAPALNLTSPAVGQVIGSDGKNYAYGSLPTGVTAVAKICYVSGSHGLALALEDEGQMIWSTAISTCAAHTPAFTGGTWKLASLDEWNNMITAAGSHTDLRDGFSSVGGTNMQLDCYWSSSEVDSESAWLYYFGNGQGYSIDDYKDSGYFVRACLVF